MKECLSVKMVTVNILLSVLFVSEAGFTGALASCYTTSFNITAPKEMEALTGSCLLIPCHFEENSGSSGSSRSTGVWIKNDSNFKDKQNNVIFNSSRTDNSYPMNITGDLSQKNCTTLFSNLTTSYKNKYFFRIEKGSFKATAVCHPVQINVTDSPPRPTIQISGDQREGASVTVTCSAQAPCPHSPPKLTWNLHQDPRSIMEENTDRTFTTKTQEIMTLSEKHDGYNITCSASYSVNINNGRDVKTAEVNMILNISYGPKDTSASISPSGLVSAGSWVNLTCSSRAKPPISHFTWLQQSTDGVMNVSEGALYSVRATHGAVYFCVAFNAVGNQTSSKVHLSLRVKGEPQQWQLVLGGIFGFVVLICLIVLVWRFKSTRSTAQQTQSQTHEEVAIDRKTEEENIHYGEINFSTPSSDSLQDSGQQQHCVYAQVNVSKTAKRPRQTADRPEDHYAQVMKK